MTTIDTARALLDAGRIEAAIAACRTILAEDFQDSAALSLLGRAFLAAGRGAEAIAMLAAVEAPDAGNADADIADALIQALRAVGLTGEAEARATGAGRKTAASPEAVAHLTRGNAHLFADDLDQAEAAYRDALAIAPDFAGALGNLGNVLTARGDLPAAHAAYQHALRADPNNAEIGFAYSLSLLLAGDFASGWRWHETRRRTQGLRWNYDRHPDVPQWRDGMDLTGRRVLVMAEQGHGDMIQFARLLPLLAERAAHVVLELPRTLHRVFESLPNVARLINRDALASDCDIACPLLSLPLALGLTLDTIPPPVAVAREDLVAQWAVWLGAPDGRRRIGLVVSGESRHPHDARRSIPLARFAPILGTGQRFVLLQTELRDDDRRTRESMEGLRFPGAALTDFGDTAGLIANLDLVITVDTAVAHLAGSLGVPTWLLLAHAPDHRWMLNRNDSPWYPSMRLFRQPAPGDWASVLRRMADQLD